MISIRTKADTPHEAAEKYRAAAELLRADGQGLPALMSEAVGQLQRFAQGNIEVDTGRTKNSVFGNVSGRGNSVVGMLGTNVRYAPFVRDSGHRMQFMKYAERKEVPNVLKYLGEGVVSSVEEVFE